MCRPFAGAAEIRAKVRGRVRVRIRVKFRVTVKVRVSVNNNNSSADELTDKYHSATPANGRHLARRIFRHCRVVHSNNLHCALPPACFRSCRVHMKQIRNKSPHCTM